MWITTISLPVSNDGTQDADGFRPDSEKQYLTGIPANRKDTTRNDEMMASQMGYTADVVMEIDQACYSGQSEFIDEADGTRYNIQRTFRKDKSNLIQLIGSVRDRGKEL